MKITVIGTWIVVLVAALATTTQAAFVNPSWTRPVDDTQAATDQTTYQSWNVFTSTTGPNAPDVAEINPNGTANAYDSSSAASGSFVTSGGNIYSFTAVSIEPRAIVPGFATGELTNSLVQVLVQGSLIDVDDLTLDGVSVSTLADYSYTELSSTPLGGFGGAAVEHAWTFTAPADLASFQLDWGWNAESASLDRISIDTQVAAVPEPATWALALVGMLGLGVVARRRQRDRR
ncbi:MAG: PEP-CTERM sorting domain-containing protein [Pirellulales bacterium]